MSNLPQRPDEQIDADLDRIVRSSGRSPTRGAAIAFVGAALIFAIDRLSNGTPSTLGYVAAAVIVAVTAPSLLALAIADRRRSLAWALEEQQRRELMRIRDRHVEEQLARLEVISAEVAALRRGSPRRDPSRSTTTGRRAALPREDEP